MHHSSEHLWFADPYLQMIVPVIQWVLDAQVLRRYGDGSMQVVHTQDDMPTLKEVALTILPNS